GLLPERPIFFYRTFLFSFFAASGTDNESDGHQKKERFHGQEASHRHAAGAPNQPFPEDGCSGCRFRFAAPFYTPGRRPQITSSPGDNCFPKSATPILGVPPDLVQETTSHVAR